MLFTKKVTGLDGKLGKETAQRLLGADVSLYLDAAALNKQYGDQLQGARFLLESQLPSAIPDKVMPINNEMAEVGPIAKWRDDPKTA